VLCRLAHTGVTLAKRDACFLRCIDELFACPVEQSTVGRARDGLWLHRGVEHYGIVGYCV